MIHFTSGKLSACDKRNDKRNLLRRYLGRILDCQTVIFEEEQMMLEKNDEYELKNLNIVNQKITNNVLSNFT